MVELIAMWTDQIYEDHWIRRATCFIFSMHSKSVKKKMKEISLFNKIEDIAMI